MNGLPSTWRMPVRCSQPLHLFGGGDLTPSVRIDERHGGDISITVEDDEGVGAKILHRLRVCHLRVVHLLTGDESVEHIPTGIIAIRRCQVF
jgi:hypothetical protein